MLPIADAPTEPADGQPAGADGPYPEPVTPRRNWLPTVVRVVLSAAMLAWLITKFDVSWSDLVPAWDAATIAWLAVAVVATLVSLVLSALRWYQVAGALGLPVGFRRILEHTFAGQFVSNVLPTTIGGDVVRVARMAGDTADPADSFASVVLERLSGWIVLPLLTVVGVASDAAVRAASRTATTALLVAGVTFAGLVAILFLADHPRVGGRFARRANWTRFIGAVHLGVGKLRRHRGATWRVLGAGIAFQGTLVLAAWAGAHVVGLDLAFATMLAVIPPVLMTQVLPIGIVGLGVREGMLVFMLTPLGAPQASAVALGLLLFFLTLAVSALGAPAFVTGGRRRSPVAP